MSNPYSPTVLCSDPECGAPLTQAERRAWAEHDGLCDACLDVRAARDAECALPVPPRVPVDIRPTMPARPSAKSWCEWCETVHATSCHELCRVAVAS